MSSDPTPGLSHVVFLLDESAAMQSEMAESKRTKAALTTTAVNAWLRNAAELYPGCQVALLGYRSQGDATEAGLRWGGPLAGRNWVPFAELLGNQATVETRTRQGSSETFDFPLWYVPQAGDRSPQVAAFQEVLNLLEGVDQSQQVLVIHIFAGASADGNPLQTVQKIQKLPCMPAVLQIHLGSSAAVPAIVVPGNRAYVPHGPARDLFDRSSPLPTPMAKTLQESGLAVLDNARGMVYNARLLQLSQFLGSLKGFAHETATAEAPVAPAASAPTPTPTPVVEPVSQEYTPPPAAPHDSELADEQIGSISTERPCLLLFLVDRSAGDPGSGGLRSSCSRFQEEVNNWLTQTVKLKSAFHAGLIVYGADGIGEAEVRVGFDGALAGRKFVTGDELADNALRVDEFEEEMPNGVGGLLRIPRKRQIYLETEPGGAMNLEPAASSAADLISEWRSQPGLQEAPIVVMHLTRGAFAADDVQAAGQRLAGVAGPKPFVYHEVVTEAPCAAVVYPGSTEKIPAEFAPLWEMSSGLIAREHLIGNNPFLSPAARGYVLNAEFDLFWPGLRHAAGVVNLSN